MSTELLPGWTERRRATLGDVAIAAGVSRQTVSNAYTHPHRLRPDTLASVRSAADRLEFTPNLAARAVRGSLPSLIVLGLPDLATPYARALASSFDTTAWSAGFNVQMMSTLDGSRGLPFILSSARSAAGALLVLRACEGQPASARARDRDVHELRLPRCDDPEVATEDGRTAALWLIGEISRASAGLPAPPKLPGDRRLRDGRNGVEVVPQVMR